MKKIFDKISFKKLERLSLLAGNLFNAGIGFLTFGLLARGLSKQDFGSWVLYLSVFGFIEMIRTGFVYQALVKFMAACKCEAEQKKYILGAWQISIVLTISILAISFALKIFWISNESFRFYELFFNQYQVVICLMLPINVATMIFHAKQQYFKLWGINFTQSFIFILIIFFTKKLELPSIIFAHTITRAIVVMGVLIFDRKILYLNLLLNDKINSAYSEILKFSRFTVLSTIGTSLLKSVDIWLINHFLGAGMVALYQVPLKLIEAFEIPLRTMAMSVYPRFAKQFSDNDLPNFKKNFKKELKIITIFIIVINGFIFQNLEFFIEFFAGKGYVNAKYLLQIFLIYLIFLPLDRYLGIALDASNQPKINTIKVFLMLFVNIIGDFVVLKLGLGLQAVVLVTVLNIIIGIMIGLFFLKRQFNEKYNFPIPNLSWF